MGEKVAQSLYPTSTFSFVGYTEAVCSLSYLVIDQDISCVTVTTALMIRRETHGNITHLACRGKRIDYVNPIYSKTSIV